MYSLTSPGLFLAIASLPGRPAISRVVLRRVISRALRAASRARAASMILPATLWQHWDFQRMLNLSCMADSTAGLTSLDTSLSWFGLRILGQYFGQKIAVSPSRASSPVTATFSFSSSFHYPYSYLGSVNAERKPEPVYFFHLFAGYCW